MNDLAYETFDSQIRAVLGNLQRTPGRYPTLEQQIKRYLNEALEYAAAKEDWEELKKIDIFTYRFHGQTALGFGEANEPFIPMPWNAERVMSLHWKSPSYQEVKFQSKEDMASIIAAHGTGTAGLPAFWTEWQRTAQYKNLVKDDAQLTAKSSVTDNDSANNALDVKVRYMRSGGHIGEESECFLSGVFSGAGIALPTKSPSGWPILEVSLPTGWKGDFTIEDDTGTPVEIVNIRGAEEPVATTGLDNDARFSRILLRCEKQTEVDREGILTWKSKPKRMVNGGDTPPAPIGAYLVEKATASSWRRKRNWAAADKHEALARDLLGTARGNEKPRSKFAQPRHGNILFGTGLYRWRR
jgi:hypothetical protein